MNAFSPIALSLHPMIFHVFSKHANHDNVRF